MKNGNLYKLAALLISLVLLSAVGFAQSDKEEKEVKKKKSMMITMTVDEDGEATEVDTIVFEYPEIDIEELMEDIDIQMEVNNERMKEIRLEVLSEMDDLQNSFHFEFDDQKEELKKAMNELKTELEQLNLEEEAQQRIKEAMEKLEEAGKHNRKQFERIVLGNAHQSFFGEDGKYEVIVEEDGKNVKTEVIWIGEDGKDSKEIEKELKVWVDADENRKVIVKSDGKIIDEENIFVYRNKDSNPEKVTMMEVNGGHFSFISPPKEKEIEEAIEAGLPIDKDNMLEDLHIFVEVKDGEGATIKLKSNAEGKLKATAYDKDFKKLKKLKVTEEDGEQAIQLDTNYLKDSEAHYLLIEQGGKTDLMRIYK